MLKFSEIFEFSKEKFRKIPILKEFEWFEWFEWFGPSPIEPFNPGGSRLRTSLSERHQLESCSLLFRTIVRTHVDSSSAVSGEDSEN